MSNTYDITAGQSVFTVSVEPRGDIESVSMGHFWSDVPPLIETTVDLTKAGYDDGISRIRDDSNVWLGTVKALPGERQRVYIDKRRHAGRHHVASKVREIAMAGVSGGGE